MRHRYLRTFAAAAGLILGLLAAPLWPLAPVQAATVDTSTLGTSFRTVFTPTNVGTPTWKLFLSSAQSGTATVTWADGTTETLTITASTITEKVVPSAPQMLAADSGAVAARISTIESTVPIAVYGCVLQAAASDCTTYYPTATWGTAYRLLYAKSSFGQSHPPQITVVGTAQASTLSFTPASDLTTSTGNYTAGQTYNISLSANQVWTTKILAAGQDFSGSLITSTAQIGVLNGAQCENFGGTFPNAGGACDISVQMVPPVSVWGKTFYSVNYKNTGTSGSGYRIVAHSDGTEVTVSGDETYTTTLNAGKIFQFEAFRNTGANPNRSIVITANKPILVGHYLFNGTYVSLGASDTGDPSMAYLTPFQQFLDSYTIASPASFKASFINVLIPATAVESLRLDGNSVDAAAFRDVSGTTWKSAQLEVTEATHNLTADQAFGIEVYGADTYDSYAYTGGQNFALIENVAELQLQTANAAGTVGQEVCIAVRVLDANGVPVQGVRVDATITGVSGTVYLNDLADSNGDAQLCYTGTAVGNDSAAFSANGFTASSTVTWSLVAPSISYNPNTAQLGTGAAMPSLTPTNAGGAVTTWAISPALPGGLDFNTATGVISGTPAADFAASAFTVTATNAAGTSTATVTLSAATPIVPSITYSPDTYVFTLDQTITVITPTVVGTFPTWSVSPSLPEGLTLNTQNGSISGKPTRITAATDYTVTATNSAGSQTDTVRLSVTAIAPDISYTPASFSFVSGTAISTITPTNAGSPVSSWSITPALPAGLAFNGTTGSISGTPSTNSAQTDYTVTATNSAGSDTAIVTITVAATLALPDIAYATTTISAVVGSAITTLVPTNVGGPVASWSISPALPAGLAFNAASGRVSGTPTAVTAQANYTVTATNATGTDTATLSITVSSATPSAPNIAYSPSTLEAVVDEAITAWTPTNTGGAATSWSVSPALPAGLSLNTTTGAITGTATAETASATYVVTATNAGGSDTASLTISVVTGVGGRNFDNGQDNAPAAPAYPLVEASPATITYAAGVVTATIGSYSQAGQVLADGVEGVTWVLILNGVRVSTVSPDNFAVLARHMTLPTNESIVGTGDLRSATWTIPTTGQLTAIEVEVLVYRWHAVSISTPWLVVRA